MSTYSQIADGLKKAIIKNIDDMLMVRKPSKISDWKYSVTNMDDPSDCFNLSSFHLPYTNISSFLDQSTFPAVYIPRQFNTNIKNCAAIYIHGVSGHYNAGTRYYNKLAHMGMPVYLISYRNDVSAPNAKYPGYNDPIYTLGIKECEDLNAAILNIINTYGILNFVLIGDSMGGGLISNFLAQYPEHNNLIKAIIMDAPALSFFDILVDKNKNVPNKFLPYVPEVVYSCLEEISDKNVIDWVYTIDKNNYTDNIYNIIAKTKIPILVSHCIDDKILPYSITQSLIKACEHYDSPITSYTTNPVNFYWDEEDKTNYPNCKFYNNIMWEHLSHLSSWFADTIVYEKNIEEFLIENIK